MEPTQFPYKGVTNVAKPDDCLITSMRRPERFAVARQKSNRVFPATLVIVVHLALFYIAIAQSVRMGSINPNNRQIGSVVEANLYRALPQTSPGAAGKKQDSVTPRADAREATRSVRTGLSAEQSERHGTGTDGIASQSSNSAANPARTETGTDIADDVATEFQHQLLSHIEPFLKYPEDARAAHPEGIVVVLFSMTRDGTVLGAWIKQSSGSASLDREAIAAIMKAQPLPAIPPQLPDPLNVELPVSFDQ